MCLVTSGDFQELPLSFSTEGASILPIVELSPSQQDNDEKVQDSGLERGMTPLMSSRLDTVIFCGPWVMSDHDLYHALTFYAQPIVPGDGQDPCREWPT